MALVSGLLSPGAKPLLRDVTLQVKLNTILYLLASIFANFYFLYPQNAQIRFLSTNVRQYVGMQSDLCNFAGFLTISGLATLPRR